MCDQLRSSYLSISETKHINTILVRLPTEHDHVVAVNTTSRQPYDLPAVASVLVDVESREHDVLLQLIISSTAFNTTVASSQTQSPETLYSVHP